jgi:hypothetical protein
MQHGSPPSRQLLFSARVVPMGGKNKKKIDRTKLGDILTPFENGGPDRIDRGAALLYRLLIRRI